MHKTILFLGIAMIENILEHIAFETNVDPADARMINLVPGNKMNDLLPRFLKSTEYRNRRKEIDSFNEKNRWIKKGLGLTIMEYPLLYFGQYPATVSIYHADGSVVISHGGIEMGQGISRNRLFSILNSLSLYIFHIFRNEY